MKKIAFIATREPDYSRVSIIRNELKKYYDVDEFVSRQPRYSLRFLAIALRLLFAWATGRLKKYDAVFVGFFAQPVFPLVRLLYRGPVIADAYFSLFDTMVHDKGKTRATSLVGRFCFWLDRYMLRHAEMCFTDTAQHIHYLRDTFDTPHADVRRLWISAESQPLESRPAAPAAGESFEVLFWGGFIPLQGVDTIVRAAHQLQEDNVQFTIFGAGQTLADCLRLRQQLDVKNIEFAGWQHPETISRQAARSHVALGIFGTTEKAGRVIPNKAYEALALGIPLITRHSPATEELLRDRVHCLLVDAGDAEALARQILWARDHYSDVVEIAARGQQLFMDTCSPAETGRILQQEINLLLSPESAGRDVDTPTAAGVQSA